MWQKFYVYAFHVKNVDEVISLLNENNAILNFKFNVYLQICPYFKFE